MLLDNLFGFDWLDDKDVRVDGKKGEIYFLVPNVQKSDIHLNVSEGTLHVSVEPKDYLPFSGKAHYDLDLGYGVTGDDISAKLDGGVLTVKVNGKKKIDEDEKQIEID